MSGKCSICVSKYREWIEEQHGNGKPLRDISKELEEQFGESISHVAISNHINKHMGGDSDRTEQLEARVRNLEMWMAKAIPATTALTWFEHGPRGDEKFSISDYTLYKSSIPDFDALAAEEAALKSEIVSKHKAARAKREEQQRREAVKRNESIAAEKREREEQAKKARAKIEKQRIDKLREEVHRYDNGEVTIS